MINYFTCVYSLHMCRHIDTFWFITSLIFSNFTNEYINVMLVMWPLAKLFLLILLLCGCDVQTYGHCLDFSYSFDDSYKLA